MAWSRVSVEEAVRTAQAIDGERVVGVVRSGRSLAWIARLTKETRDFYMLTGAEKCRTMYANLRELRAMPLEFVWGEMP